jgi:prepilin-type N-terminal cleavage/methylation domain-containing protein
MAASNPTLRRGFTLIELLVVVSIIGVLAAIVLVAGGRVLAGGKKTATQDVLRMLDTALEAYISSKDGLPASSMFIATDAAGATLRLVPLADARNGERLPDADPARAKVPGSEMINSGGLFLLQANEVPSAKSHIEGIPQKFIKSVKILGNASAAGERLILTPVDSWGRPIRFVMPGFDGIVKADASQEPGSGASLDDARFPQRKTSQQWAVSSIRRNGKTGSGLADSDGGKCVGKRPYFYSCGEDGDPSTIEDNVYTTIPTISKN